MKTKLPTVSFELAGGGSFEPQQQQISQQVQKAVISIDKKGKTVEIIEVDKNSSFEEKAEAMVKLAGDLFGYSWILIFVIGGVVGNKYKKQIRTKLKKLVDKW